MKQFFKTAMSSWKTTTLGVLMLIQAIITLGISYLDGNPETVPDWNATMFAIAEALAAIGLIGFIRDADKSTEQTKVKEKKTRFN